MNRRWQANKIGLINVLARAQRVETHRTNQQVVCQRKPREKQILFCRITGGSVLQRSDFFVSLAPYK